MSKLTPLLLLIALLLLVTLSHAARPNPVLLKDSPLKTQHVVVVDDIKEAEENAVEESCEGVVGEDECLMRRTLVAQGDYIYTQSVKP